MKNINPVNINILFGLQLDQSVQILTNLYDNYVQFGPNKLLIYLETQLGIGGHKDDIQHLRTEFYKNCLSKYLVENKDAFFQKSFEANPLASAELLLNWRDELFQNGFDFELKNTTPTRIKVLIEVEKIVEIAKKKTTYYLGFAERWQLVTEHCAQKNYYPKTVLLNEPLELLPVFVQRLLAVFSKSNIQYIDNQLDTNKSNDLSLFKGFINDYSDNAEKGNKKFQNDGSITILKAKRDVDLASALSKWNSVLMENQVAIFLQGKNKTLENALVTEGNPRLGVAVQSLAHPLLQIIKIWPVFFYKPLDPSSVLAFLNLNFKPLDTRLSQNLANALSQKPGVGSENWEKALSKFWLSQTEYLKYKNPVDIKNQYLFIFENTQYKINEAIPKEDLIFRFQYLLDWAIGNDELNQYNSAKTLQKQLEQIIDFLKFTNSEIFYLIDIERLINIIFQASAVYQGDKETNALTTFHHSGQMIAPVERLIFADFVNNDNQHFVHHWNKAEQTYFEQIGIAIETPSKLTKLSLFYKNRSILMSQKQLIIALPNSINGEDKFEHSLMGDLRACFSDIEHSMLNIDNESETEWLKKVEIEVEVIEKTPAILNVNTQKDINRERESPSSIEQKLFYPHIYALNYWAKLSRASINTLPRESTMKGNLSHSVLEQVLHQDYEKWTKADCSYFVVKACNILFETEGVPLLMYGKTPEKESFVNMLKSSAWTLINLIKNNNWKVKSTEQSVDNQVFNKAMNGRIDLVLERNDELMIVDLKFGSIGTYRDKVKNGMDIQLMMYANMLAHEGKISTAYYVINHQKMIAHNTLGFKEADVHGANAPDAELMAIANRKIENTLAWREEQLQNGILEFRTKDNINDLEDYYQDVDWNDKFEMPNYANRFDDFEGLIV